MAVVRRSAAAALAPVLAPVADVTPAGAPRGDAEVVVLPGVSPRRLPVVVAPRAGESLPSWVDRAAAEAEVPAGQMALALGLQVRDQPGDVRPLFYGIALTPASQIRLGTATGLRDDEIAGMQLSRFAGSVLDFTGLDLSDERTVQPLVQREWALFHASRACPHCLAASGGVWPLWWRLGVAAVCPEHRVLLVDACLACGIPLRRGYASHPRGLSRVATVDLLSCGNYRPDRGGRCPQRLDELPTVAVDADLTRVQQQVLDSTDGEPRLAGRPVSTAVWFAALRYLTALVRFAADPADVAAAGDLPAAVDAFTAERDRRRRTSAGAPTALRRIPGTAPLAAALLATTLPVLAAANADQATARLAPLVEVAARRRRAAQHDPLRSLTAPAPLDAILQAVTPPASRVVGAMPRPAGPQVTWQIRHLPHLADADDYTRLVAGLLPGTAAVTGRRMTALALARLAGAASWRQAAAAMGMAARWASLDSYLSRRIRDAAGFWAAVQAVGDRLAARGLIDYAARRRAVSGLLEVPHGVLFAVCQPLAIPVTAARCRHAAAWIWEQVTGGDVREAPALAPFGADVAAESVREVHRRFVRWLPTPLAHALRGWAAGYLAARATA